MYRKVSEFCANEEWKKKQMAEIMAIEPEPVIPVGEESWEQVWSANHDKAGDIKLSARKGELELNDALWVKERQGVMFEIVLNKFSPARVGSNVVAKARVDPCGSGMVRSQLWHRAADW